MLIVFPGVVSRAVQVRMHGVMDSMSCPDHNDHINHIGLETAMITETTAVNFRQNLGEMLNRVQYRNDSIVINKDGKPVAVLVDAELFARIRRLREQFDALAGRVADAYAEVPMDEGLAEIDAAVAAERGQR